MKALRTFILGGVALMLLRAQNANVQFIHAVADVVGVLDSLDIYLSTDGGSTWSSSPFIPDFKFRQATAYLSVPANSSTTVLGVAPGNSTSSAQVVLTFPLPSFTSGSYNVIIFAGTIDFVTSTANINLYHKVSQPTASSPNLFEFIVFHGANDVGTVDVYIAYDRTTSAYQPDLTLGQYAYHSGYLGLSDTNFIVLDTTPANKNDILPIGFLAPIPSSLLGQTGVVFASGYVNTSDANKAFGLHVALANGTVIALSTRDVRRLQIVHNAADTSLAQVDIHPGGVGSGDPISLDFRQATPTFFLDAPTGQSVPIAITKRGQTSPIVTVNVTIPPAGQNHIVFAQGVVNPAQYASNPNSVPTAFTLHPITNIKGWANSTSFITVPFHGVTDAPAVDIYAGNSPIAMNIKYLDYASEVTLSAGTSANIEVRPAGNSTPLATFQLASTQSQGGVGTVIFASGFLNPSANRNGPAFGLFIVYPDGTVRSLSAVSGVNAAMPYQISGVAGNPSATGEWTLYLGATTQGEVPYMLTTLAGQVLQQGTYTLPGAGTWAYKINGENLPTGVYLLRLGAETIRLVRL